MKPAAFEYFRPASIDEAIDLLDRHGEEARPIAGGQSLVPTMNLRLATPAVLVDISRIAALQGWRRDGDVVRIGAATRQAALLGDSGFAAAVPLLAMALTHVGHVQTRSRGTIGGSLVHGDPAAEIGLVAATLDAEIVLRGARGERRLPVRDFQLGALATDVAAGELLVEIILPVAVAGTRCAFRELARRRGDFALVAVAAQRTYDRLAVCIGGLEAVPRRCTGLSTRLALEDLDARADAIGRELASVTPLADLHASGDYRRHLAAVLLEDCLREVLT